jgi:hypothetical protein
MRSGLDVNPSIALQENLSAVSKVQKYVSLYYANPQLSIQFTRTKQRSNTAWRRSSSVDREAVPSLASIDLIGYLRKTSVL